jgi:hypothetical protein
MKKGEPCFFILGVVPHFDSHSHPNVQNLRQQ